MPESTKKCPFWESEVPETAIKYKYCGEVIDKKYQKTENIIYRNAFQTSKLKSFVLSSDISEKPRK